MQTLISQFREPFNLPAYARRRAEIQAVPHENLLPITLDIPTIVTVARTSWVPMHARRGDLLTTCRAFDVASFDAIDDYALVTSHLHTMLVSAIHRETRLPELQRKAAAVRRGLLANATTLVQRGLVDGRRLHGMRGGAGSANTAFDLVGLVSLLRESWQVAGSVTTLRIDALDAAEALAEQLVLANELRQRAPLSVVALALERRRAFTLLVRSYERARHAIRTMRRIEVGKDDVDLIAPSLYATRRVGWKRTLTPASLRRSPDGKLGNGNGNGRARATNAKDAAAISASVARRCARLDNERDSGRPGKRPARSARAGRA